MARTRKLKAVLIGLLCGGSALATTASCDPRTGAFEFFRDDDNEFFVDDGYYGDGFFFDEYYYEDDYGYYDDYGFVGDCAWDCY